MTDTPPEMYRTSGQLSEEAGTEGYFEQSGTVATAEDVAFQDTVQESTATPAAPAAHSGGTADRQEELEPPVWSRGWAEPAEDSSGVSPDAENDGTSTGTVQDSLAAEDRFQSTSPGIGEASRTAEGGEPDLELPSVAVSFGDLPSPRWAASMPNFGPCGKHRRPWLAVLLSVFTLGIYSLYWYGRINSEMREFDPRMVVHPGRARAAILLPWLATWVAAAAAADRLLATHSIPGIAPVAALASAPYVHMSALLAVAMLVSPLLLGYVILLVPFSVVGATMTLERIRIVEDRVGTPTDLQLSPSSSINRLLIPVFGGLSLITLQQRRLNAVWSTADELEVSIFR